MIDWQTIDTVFLDMDGTLLDLHFDNYFWLSYLPGRYAEHHGLHQDAAAEHLHGIFNEKRGTLDWYCLDFWSDQLRLDIRSLKVEIQHLIRERPQAIHFLQQLKVMGKRRILITNAHPGSLNLKLELTGIGSELDLVISSHQFGFAKEAQEFWQALAEATPFARQRSLFIDDSLSVLTAAEKYGIANLVAINKPDSQSAKIDTAHFNAIEHFDEILPQPATNG